MKHLLIIIGIIAIVFTSKCAVSTPPVREATTNEMQSGTAGLPAVVTPRRATLITGSGGGGTNGNFSGSFTGNGGGLTNLQPSQIASPWTNITAVTENFANLNAWAKEGTATFAVSGNKLWVTNNGDIFGGILRQTNYFTAAHNWTWAFNYRFVNTNGDFGAGFGIRSANTNAPESLFCGFTVGSGVSDIGWWYGNVTNLAVVGGSASNDNVVIGSSDTLSIQITRRECNYSLFVSNQTTHAIYETRHNVSTDTSTNGFESGTGNLGIWSIAGIQEISVMTFTVDTVWPVKYLLVGDSITSGYGAAGGQGYNNLLNRRFPDQVANTSASADYTWLVLQRTNEINSYGASNVVLMIGGNDIQFGTALSTIETNILNLVSSITASGKIYIAEPTPRNAYDMTPLAVWIRNSFPHDQVIDTFTPLVNGYHSASLKARYSFDGVHPSTDGHEVIAEVIETKLKGR